MNRKLDIIEEQLIKQYTMSSGDDRVKASNALSKYTSKVQDEKFLELITDLNITPQDIFNIFKDNNLNQKINKSGDRIINEFLRVVFKYKNLLKENENIC